MKAISVVLFFLCLCFSPFTTFAEVKTFVHTVRQPFSGSQSPDDARVAATHKAKREVLEKAGTYLESIRIVEEGRLTKDQILALASGVLKTEIISQKNYMEGEGFGIIIKARVKVDTSMLGNRVKKLMADPTAMKQLTASREKEKELLIKIERLEEANRRLAKKKETQAVKKQKRELKNDFQQTAKELDALSLLLETKRLSESWGSNRTIQEMNKVIALYPGNAMAYNNRGDAYGKLQQYYRAIQDLDKAISLDPGNALFYYNRGVVYFALQQYARAIRDYDKAIALDPVFVYAYNNRALAYGSLLQFDRAIQDIEKVLSLAPGMASAYISLGVLYFGLQQNSRACTALKKGCELGDCRFLKIAINKGYCN